MRFCTLCLFLPAVVWGSTFSLYEDEDFTESEEAVFAIGVDQVARNWSLVFLEKAEIVVGVFNTHCLLPGRSNAPMNLEKTLSSRVSLAWSALRHMDSVSFVEQARSWRHAWGMLPFCKVCSELVRWCIDEAKLQNSDLPNLKTRIARRSRAYQK